MKRAPVLGILILTWLAACPASPGFSKEEGLLFYLSGENGFTADFASGKREPNFLSNVELIPDGATGTRNRPLHPGARHLEQNAGDANHA